MKDNQLFSNLADAMVAMAPQLGLSQPIPSSKKKTRKKEKKNQSSFRRSVFTAGPGPWALGVTGLRVVATPYSTTQQTPNIFEWMAFFTMQFIVKVKERDREGSKKKWLGLLCYFPK